MTLWRNVGEGENRNKVGNPNPFAPSSLSQDFISKCPYTPMDCIPPTFLPSLLLFSALSHMTCSSYDAPSYVSNVLSHLQI